MRPGLPRYASRRLAQLLPLMLVVIVLNFTLIKMAPGDPAYAIAGENAPREYIESVRIRYGLDRPFLEQLGRYLGMVVRGDFGYSYMYHRPVISVILEKLPATLLLMGSSMSLAMLVGTLLGTYAAKRHGTWVDRVVTSSSLGLYSMPVFWLGLMLILFFAISLRWFPSSGMVGFLEQKQGLAYAIDVLWHMSLPTLTLFIYYSPAFLRVTRASVLEISGEDFIATSRAIGYSENRIYFKYALKNAVLPAVTLAGLNLGLIFAGALLTETVFSWPGTGRLMFEAAYQRDYPIMMGIFVITSACVVLGNLLADLVYGLLDPRVVYK